MLATFPPTDDRYTAGCEAVPDPAPADALWCVFRQGELLLATPPGLLGAAEVAGLAPLRVHGVGRLDGRPVLAA
ncbi:MAG: hypothetical protein JWM10_3294, partial [Myxococcaceae bacterium]|nr:hypothetical protein [Myxococcaceae bacterium]